MDIDIFEKNISFGLMPFETLYFNNNEIEDVDKHFKRLKRAHNILKIDFDVNLSEFSKALYDYVAKLDCSEGVLKVVYYNKQINISYRLPNYTSNMFKQGLKLKTSKIIKGKNNIFNYIKTFNYGVNYMEDVRAKKVGYDTALFLNEKGYICETSYANIFFVKDNEIYTPHLRSGILKGIMRDNIIRFLSSKGYRINKTFIGYNNINNFDECFLTNSVIGIMPVKQIDDVFYNGRSIIELIIKFKKFWRSWMF